MIVFTVLFLTITVTGNADITVPNKFTSGTTISSSRVNANFSTLANAMSGVTTTIGPFLTTITGTVSNNATTIMSISVTPPASGNVIVMGSGTVFIDQNQAPKYNKVIFSLNTVSGATRYPEYVVHSFGPYSDAAPGVAIYKAESLHIVDVFPVTGGITTTIYLNAYRDTTAVNVVQAEHPRLTAIFVPNTLP